MAKEILTTFQFKRGTAARWAEVNPILREGEPGFVIDTNTFKIGDGITHFSDLKDFSINTLRRDNDYNYKKIENTFIPAKGEVCFVDVAGYGLRTKVGDGSSTFAQLPYLDETTLQTINSLIVKGYYYQNQFYYNNQHTELVEAIIGRVYVDNITGKIYGFDGFDYITQGGDIPRATSQTVGIAKLYNETGQNTDGSMTQQAITNELNEKFEMDVVEEEEMIIFDIDID